MHIDNRGNNILIFGKGQAQTQGLDNTMLTAEAQYSSNFLRSNRKLCFSLHYNGSNSFLFVNAKNIYQLKAKDSEIKKNIPCVWEIFQEIFQLINLKKKKAGLNKFVYNFSVDYKAFVISDITNIHKYLMKKPDIK